MKPNRPLIIAITLLASLALPGAGTMLHAAEPSPAKSSPRVDPAALAQLKRMSDSLGSAPAFRYKSSSTVEVPSKTGQFLTLFPTTEVAVKRPDKLRVRVSGEAPPFDFFYDGTNVAAYAPATKVYSVVKAPSTIDVMLPDLERETNIRFASMPLLFSNPYSILSRGITSAVVVGKGDVRGVPCEHLAFRAPGVNWEIWIESGARALPLRLSVTYTDRANFPRTLVEFSNWNLHPWLSNGGFVFKAPSDAKEIPFGEAMNSSRR